VHKTGGELNGVKSTLTDLNNLAVQIQEEKMVVAEVKKGVEAQRELGDKGLNVPVQMEILEAAKKSGEPQVILHNLNMIKGVNDIIEAQVNESQKLEEIKSKIDEGVVELGRQNVERMRHKTYMDMLDVLIVKNSFDSISLGTLLSVAGRYGSPPEIVGAVNAYVNLEDIKQKTIEAQAALTVVDTKNIEADAQYGKLQKLNDEANRILGEING
jgi:hypothetical protein